MTHCAARLATLILSFFLLAAAPAGAGTVKLSGSAAQGGLMIGHTEAGASARLDGEPVRVSPGGWFVLAFPREAEGQSRLVIDFADGTSGEWTLDVEQREFPVQRIDGLPDKKVTPDPEALERIRADAAAITRTRERDTAEPLFANGFDWPVTGTITGVFGSQRILNGNPRSPHRGVDVAAPAGTPVSATADGIVALVHPDMFFTGKTVMLDHGHGVTSVYAHMRDITVAEGQRVAQGEPIGSVGASGRATGPHLHWGLSVFETHVDPALAAGPMQ